MKSNLGLVAKLTKKQTFRHYFSGIPIGTLFIIVEEHNPPLPAYDLTGYFLNYPPQELTNGKFHYTGFIEKGSWEIVGEVNDCIKEILS